MRLAAGLRHQDIAGGAVEEKLGVRGLGLGVKELGTRLRPLWDYGAVEGIKTKGMVKLV